MPQDQFLRQDVVAQQNLDVLGSTTLGNDPSDIVSVVGRLSIGGTSIQPVASANYGPGPLTNVVLLQFSAASYDAAVCTVAVADDANDDLYVATFTIGHDGSTAVLSSAYGVVDVWGGTNPTFNANLTGGNVQLRMSLADSVSVAVAADVKYFNTQTSPEITISVQPANGSVTAPAPNSFFVTASTNDGGTLSYQWEVSSDGGSTWANATGGVYSGDTTATLAVTDSTGLNGYQYRVVVGSSGTASDITSSAATLTVA